MKKTLYFNIEQADSLFCFKRELKNFIRKTKKEHETLVLVCIGTDRATGDCLGPLVGYYLEKVCPPKLASIFGNLSKPVHAINLEDTMKEIYLNYEKPFIIVVDACLGREDHVGYVTLSNSSLTPGEGVCKVLPSLGNISITGIVDCYCKEDITTIQNTHLYQVMKLADFIATGIMTLFSSYPSF